MGENRVEQTGTGPEKLSYSVGSERKVPQKNKQPNIQQPNIQQPNNQTEPFSTSEPSRLHFASHAIQQ
jgi:hypothetical protein